MTTFAATFRTLVMPTLAQRCREAGYCVERGHWTFEDAAHGVMDFARKRGANHLPEQIWRDLDEWVDIQILNASIEFEDPEKRKVIEDDLISAAMKRFGISWPTT